MPEVAYTAGILDGEGSIQIHRRKGRRRAPFNYDLRIRFSNTCRELLLSIGEDHKGSTTKRRRINRRIDYELTIVGYEAVRLIKDTLPFLRVKKDQAQLALMLPRASPFRVMSPEMLERQTVIYERMKVLNRKGARVAQLNMHLSEDPQWRFL